MLIRTRTKHPSQCKCKIQTKILIVLKPIASTLTII